MLPIILKAGGGEIGRGLQGGESNPDQQDESSGSQSIN